MVTSRESAKDEHKEEKRILVPNNNQLNSDKIGVFHIYRLQDDYVSQPSTGLKWKSRIIFRIHAVLNLDGMGLCERISLP